MGTAELWEDANKFQKICCFFAEFLGVMLLVLVGSLSIYTFAATGGEGGMLVPALGHGMTIAVGIIAFGSLSGGHFNPAVTLAVMICKQIHPLLGLFYILAQLCGGIVGGFLVRACIPGISGYFGIQGGCNVLAADANGDKYLGQAVAVEVFVTFILVTTVLASAYAQSHQSLAPLGIGLAVFLGIVASGSISGGSLNPARSLGTLVPYGIFYEAEDAAIYTKPGDLWEEHWVHWIGPLVGGVLAAVIHRLLYPDEHNWIQGKHGRVRHHSRRH